MEAGIPEATQEFREFIISLLMLGGLTEKRIEEFTDKDSMRQFRIAFIHRSYDSEDNYELVEFLGDAVVNNCLAFYLKKRFPEVSDNAFITSLKHKYQSKTELYEMARKEGFLKHILYGKEMKEIVNSRNPSHNKDYRSMLEDTLEAFIGTVVIVIDSKTRNGVGNPIACNIMDSLSSKIDISLDVKKVFTDKQRLKEVYDKPLDWEIKEEIETRRYGSEWRANIYGYPSLIREKRFHPLPKEEKPLKTNFNIARELLAVGYGPDEKVASNRAAKQVLELLERDFGIHQTKKVKDAKPEIQLDIPPEFKSLIVHFLKLGRVRDSEIEKFTDKKSLLQFRKSFIHKSYGDQTSLLKFLGDVIVDNCMAFYLKRAFPKIINVDYLTRLRHNISKDDILGLSIDYTGIFKYILYGDKYKDSIEKHDDPHDSEYYSKILKSAFNSFIGTMVPIINNKTIDGAGYLVAYNIVSHYLNKRYIPLDFESVFQPSIRLKELYDKFKWAFDKEKVGKKEGEDGKIWKTTFYGYPFGDRRPDPSQRVVIGEGLGRSKKRATENAAKNALIYLKNYGICETRKDPYKKN